MNNSEVFVCPPVTFEGTYWGNQHLETQLDVLASGAFSWSNFQSKVSHNGCLIPSRYGFLVTWSKGEVVPVAITKACGPSVGVAPLLLTFGSRLRYVINFTPPPEKSPGSHCVGVSVGPRTSQRFVQEKNVAHARNRTTVPLSCNP